MKRYHIGSWRLGQRAGRSPWLRAAMKVTIALAAAALALPLLAAAPAPAASGGPRRLQVLARRQGAMAVEPSALTARALGLGARARAGGPVQHLSVLAAGSQSLVPLDTIKRNSSGSPGVQVGSSFYADPGSAPLQLLVLDRSDLSPVLNLGLGVNPPPAYFGPLGELLQQLPATDLVIITRPGGTGSFPTDSLPSLNDALGKIGGTLAAHWSFPAGGCWSGATNACSNPANSDKWVSWQRGAFNNGSFTVIGVPGLKVGQAWRETAYQTHSQDGRIAGYLTPGTATSGGTDYYTVINGGPDQYAPVDTCAGASCAVRVGINLTGTISAGSNKITSATSNNVSYQNGATIEGPGIPPGATIVSGAFSSTLTISSPATASAAGVGLTVNQSYPAPGSNPNGLHVLSLERTTLRTIVNRTVTNTTELLSALNETGFGTTAIGHFLVPSYSMDDQRLVIIQSVGNGQVSGKATAPLLQYLDELGGTPDLLLGTLSGHRYALVGAATNLPWRNSSALESSSQIPVIRGSRQMETGQISGVLDRDRDGLYTPLGGDPISATNTGLYRILYQPAQPWPYAADTQDLRYIADSIGLCPREDPTCKYADVRSAYPNLNLASTWPIYYTRLDKLGCTDPSKCGPDFAAVQAELLDEFEWIISVYQLGTNLLAPYNSAAARYFSVQDVVKEVRESVPVGDSTTVTMQWLSIISNVMALGSSIVAHARGPGSAVFGIIASAGALATSVMEQPGSKGGPADTVTAAAHQLAGAMAKQEAAYTQWVDQMEGILLSDYGKLSAVGKAMLTPQWEWVAGVTTSKAITALDADATASAYSALLPKEWPAYNLKPDMKSQFSSNDVRTLKCNPGNTVNNYPFANALPQNQFHAITTITGDGGRDDQAWVLAKLNLADWKSGSLVVRSAQLPTRSVTDKIYGPESIGADGAYQYEPVWWRDTYNPPSHTICSAWNGSSSGLVPSTAYAPPDIAPPPP